MANRKSTWKYNKLLTARRNYFVNGGLPDNMVNASRQVGSPGSVPNIKVNTDAGNGNNGIGALAGAATVASQAMSDIFEAVNTVKGVKQKGESMVKAIGNSTAEAQSSNDNWDTLNQDWNNRVQRNHITTGALFGKNNGDIALGAIGSSIRGAGAGSSLGPWGAIASGVGGLVSNLTGNLLAKHEAHKQKKKVNAAIDAANEFDDRAYNERVANLLGSELSGLNATYAATGGRLNRNKHSFGGELNTQGADFTNGLLYIDEGGSHETNPNEGVPMGIDSQGIPNLVEEGETIFNDYVFSKRLMVPEPFTKKYKLGGRISFAEASKKLAEESEERPNDPISIEGLRASMQALMEEQEKLKAENEVIQNSVPAEAPVTDTGMTQEPQNIGLPGMAYGGLVNRFDDGGNKEKILKSYRRNLKKMGYTLEEIDYIMSREFNGDKITMPFEEYDKSDFDRLAEEYRAGLPVDRELIMKNGDQTSPLGTASPIIGSPDSEFDSTEPTVVEEEYVDRTPKGLNTTLRYAPVVGSALNVGLDLAGITNKPNYRDANAILEATKSAGTFQPVEFNPIGNYMSYNPIDEQRMINNINANAAATRRALLQNAGMNRGIGMAGILAADNSYINNIGEAAVKAAESNRIQRQTVETFNRDTDKINSEGILQANMANQKSLAEMRDFRLKGTLAAAEMRQKERADASAARSANLTGLFQGLGDIGYENFNMNMANSVSPYYRIRGNGQTYYTNEYFNLSPEERARVDEDFNSKYIKPVPPKAKTERKAKGGYLTVKRKKKKR